MSWTQPVRPSAGQAQLFEAPAPAPAPAVAAPAQPPQPAAHNPGPAEASGGSPPEPKKVVWTSAPSFDTLDGGIRRDE